MKNLPTWLCCSILALARLTAADNALTPAERVAGWPLLFNGTDFSGWKCNNGKPIAAPIENGALYDLVPISRHAGRPAGEWNSVEITCRGPHLSVKVNGEAVSAINCDDFTQPGVCPDGEKHKFKLNGQPRAVKDFARRGYLGFQDHGQKVWYKNVKLLAL